MIDASVGDPQHVEAFLALFGDSLSERSQDSLREFAGSGIEAQVKEAVDTWTEHQEDLSKRIKRLTAAADRPLMEMSLGIIRRHTTGDRVGIAAVAVTDTSEGRIVTGPVRSDSGDWWTTVTPGTLAAGANALTNLLGTVGLSDWYGHDRSA